jgi:hypothetical protein
VLAGKNGLSRRHIKWCHIIYGRNVEGWLKQNSLLIITGLGLHDIEEDMIRIIRHLDECKGAGIVVDFGSYITVIPPRVLGVSDQLSIPLVRLPSRLTIAEFTYGLGRLLFNTKKTMDSTLKEILCFPYQNEMKYRAEQFGYDDCYPYVTYAININDQVLTQSMRNNIISAFCQLTGCARNNILSFYENTEGYFLIPFTKGNPQRDDRKHTALELKRYISQTEPHTALSIGVGSVFSSLRQFKESASNAKYALHMLRLRNQKDDVRMYEDLGIYRLLFRCRNNETLINLYNHVLGDLVRYDLQYKSNLTNTLEYFLDCGCNIGLTAERLYVHRNTLKYRIKKIQDILLIDFSDVNRVFTLQMAYKIKKYLHFASMFPPDAAI